MEAVRSGGNTPEARPVTWFGGATTRGLVVVLTNRTDADGYCTCASARNRSRGRLVQGRLGWVRRCCPMPCFVAVCWGVTAICGHT
jgi:hypothetical protein